MKFFCLIISLLTISLGVLAQSNRSMATTPELPDSIKAIMAEQAALMYPRLRQLTITHEENGVGRMTSELNGEKFSKSDFRSSGTTINFNMPVFQRGTHAVVANIGGMHRRFETSNVRNYDAQNTLFDDDLSVPMLSAGLGYVHTANLFDKNITFSAMANGIFTPSFDQSQFVFTGIAIVPFIQRPTTRLSVGAIVLINPASPVPFFFMASYFHKFKSCDLDLMVDLPYRASLRKSLGSNASLTFFNELGGTNAFFDFKHPGNSQLSRELTFSTLEIKSGLMAEYRINRKAVVSLSAGANFMANSKIRESNSKPKDYFFRNEHKPVPFVQVGFSLLPFWKGLRL